MSEVNCNVANCSYFCDQKCCLQTLNIGGKCSSNECHTCCGSYLNASSYSNLSDYTKKRGMDCNINCTVNTCIYNENSKCSLDSIQVSGKSDAVIYSETECSSFEK